MSHNETSLTAQLGSPSRKRARLSNESASSVSRAQIRPIPQRPPPSAEARRKRQLAIAAALNEPLPQLPAKNPPPNATSSTPHSQDETIEGLSFSAINVASVSVAQPQHAALDDTTLDTSFSSVDISASPNRIESEAALARNAEIDKNTHASNSQDVGAQDSTKALQPEGAIFGSTSQSHPQPKNHELSISGYRDLPESQMAFGTQALPEIGFVSARKKPIVLSVEALEKAQEFVATIQAEATEETDSLAKPRRQSPHSRRAQLPFTSPLTPAKAKEVSLRIKMKAIMDGSVYQTSPLNPDRTDVPPQGFSTPIRKSTATTSASGPSRSSTTVSGPPLAFSSPVSFLKPGMGNQHHPVKTVRKGFSTPYKPGFRPGENGRTNMDVLYRPVPKVALPSALTISSARSIKDKGKHRAGPPLPNACFDLIPPANRRGLRESGVVPFVLDLEGLSENGIPPELPQITPSNAIYYAFHASDPRGGEPLTLGVAAALPYLRQRGCSLATQEWVDNHWSLVLWKRASIVCCKPTLLKELWSFESTCKDLMYRYERDLNRTQRPIVRLIQERDASSSRPMTLCVSAIHWSEGGITEAGLVPSHPELELTDGWYRIRATVDAALARATQKKKIRLGTKIFMSGIRLNAPGEPKEVLKAYSSSSLTLCGNSTTLARWDAKLGVSQPQAPITASLRSLNPDGGVAMLLDIVVEKLFPVGYLETAPQGKRLLPTNAAEEHEARAKWEETREVEEAKIKSELKSRWFSLEGIAERAERVANGWTPGPEDEEPNSLDDLYDDLESSADFNMFYKGLTLSAHDSGWLAFYIRKRLEEQRATAGEYIENELKSILPPREVRNFRVIRVKDARVWRRPALRTAQITVWDVLALGEGFLAEGRRYLVSNLMPSQASSWPALKEEGEVFLTTRRDSRWSRLEMS